MKFLLIIILSLSLDLAQCDGENDYISGKVAIEHTYILTLGVSANTTFVIETPILKDDMEIDPKHKDESVQSLLMNGDKFGASFLPTNIAEIFPNLLSFEISFAKLTKISKKGFKNLKKLQFLRLLANNIETVDENAFEDLAELEVLSIGANRIKYLGDKTFENLQKLKHLDMSDNSFMTLSENIFANLAALKKINLKNNNLPTLPENIFQHNRKLEAIDLFNNKFVILNPRVFDGLKRLNFLDLTNNECIDKTYGSDIDSYEENYDTKVLSNVIDFGALSKDLVDNCKITFLNGTIEMEEFCENECPKTKTFVIGEKVYMNNKEIDMKYKDESIEGLIMKGNEKRMNHLPIKVAEVFPNLVHYKADYTNVVKIGKENLQNLNKLKSFSVDWCDLEEIEENTFDDLIELETLAISRNKIKYLPENVFKNLRNLRKLDLFDCDLLSLPENIFEGLTKLKKINLGENELTTLPESLFKNNRMLQEILMRDNKIAKLSVKVFEGLENLRGVFLEKNLCINKGYGKKIDSGEEENEKQEVAVFDFDAFKQDLMDKCK